MRQREGEIKLFLANNGYQINDKPLKGGINSNVYELRGKDGQKYILKVYPETENSCEKNNRLEREVNFLLLLEYCSIKKVPKLKEFDKNLDISIISWVDGTSPTKLDAYHIEQVARFVGDINSKQSLITAKQIGIDYAAEACTGIKEFTEQFLSKFQSAIAASRNIQNTDLATWISTTLSKDVVIETQKLLDKSISKQWNSSYIGTYISPSDVGIHNLLLTNSGKINFIDFEYAGFDDLSKLIADWIMQPNYTLSSNEMKLLIDGIRNKIEIIDESWLERLSDIKKLIGLKWCIIMIMRYIKHPGSRVSQLNKINQYYRNLNL